MLIFISAIILVAVIYYFSQPVGTSRWMRALLYPLLFLYIQHPPISEDLLFLTVHRYFGLAPTILAGKIDPMLFEALYVRFSSLKPQFVYLLIVFFCY